MRSPKKTIKQKKKKREEENKREITEKETVNSKNRNVNLELPVYDLTGQKISKERLVPEIFGLEINPDLIYQVVVSQMANRRQGTAHTKDRGEVRGGGRKPWRQKGTGRARHGSIRSPLWRGGGVTFGPRKERVFKKIIPKKIKRKALFMVLSGKLKNDLLILLDELKIEKPKTKLLFEIIEKLRSKIDNFKKGSILIVLPEMDSNIILASRNIPKVGTIQAKDINALDLLSFKYLILPKRSIEVIKETFLK